MKEIISTNKAPGAIGPYSQAVRFGGMIFTAGQLPIDPKSGEMAKGIEAQTEKALENIKGVLEAGGYTLSDVIKITLFLKDMNDFNSINTVYGTFFKENFPARSAVEVARLPKDALIEIEAVAVKDI